MLLQSLKTFFQHGFIKKTLSVTQILFFLSIICKVILTVEEQLVVFLDVMKAFDSISQMIPLQNFYCYDTVHFGFDEAGLKLKLSYCTDRSHKV